MVIDTIKHPELGIINVGSYKMKYIEDVMTLACNYKTTTPDVRCEGCLK